MSKNPTIRFRVDFSQQCSVGIGKIELLEAIARVGSLSRAARELHMSYRRAWLLLQDMNGCFDYPVAATSVGGRGGGGVELTAFGQRLVSGYRHTEAALQTLIGKHLSDAASHATGSGRPRGATTASIRRRLGRLRRKRPAG